MRACADFSARRLLAFERVSRLRLLTMDKSLVSSTSLERQRSFLTKEHPMTRFSFCSVAMFTALAICVATANAQQPRTDSQGRHHMHATITKVDLQKDSITVKTMDKNGKEQEKTLQLPKDVTFHDSMGKTAKLSDFRTGDEVLITQKGDAITELKKQAHVTITRVDSKANKITVKMKDQSGKEIEKTFDLTADAEYIDNTGRVAALDVFRSGDQVLIIEVDGKLRGLKKATR